MCGGACRRMAPIVQTQADAQVNDALATIGLRPLFFEDAVACEPSQPCSGRPECEKPGSTKVRSAVSAFSDRNLVVVQPPSTAMH